MRYDYSNTTRDTELANMMDRLTNHQLEAVTEMVREYTQSEKERRQQAQKKWVSDALIAILRDFAEQTDSVLDIENMQAGNGLYACFRNDVGFDITDDMKGIKLAILMADYVRIDTEDDVATVHLNYML